MKTLRRELAERFDAINGVDAYSTQAEHAEEVEIAIRAVRAWLAEMSQDGQVPANRDLRNEYEFLIKEAAK